MSTKNFDSKKYYVKPKIIKKPKAVLNDTIKVRKLNEYSAIRNRKKPSVLGVNGEIIYKVYNTATKKIFGYFLSREEAEQKRDEIIKHGEPVIGMNFENNPRIIYDAFFYESLNKIKNKIIKN